MIKLGKKEGWEIPLVGFQPKEAGITKDQAVLFDQILAVKARNERGFPVINFILVYNGTAELNLTEYANTPIGTEIRTPNLAGVYCYYHEKKSNPPSLGDWGTIAKGVIDPNGLRPYIVYTALLTQTGTDAPIATVLENTIGNIVWSYSDVGKYLGTLNGAFPAGKTAVLTSSSSTTLLDVTYHQCSAQRNNDNSISLRSYSIFFDDPIYYPDYKNTVLAVITIEIRVYP
jgi:hypothetical protein